MKGAPITRLAIGHLEHVFSPPGLPLPFKGKEDVGTTSVLVRGGAGTGKTTFALALAHALALASGGAVLYLTTEFSPVEVAFKASILGLPDTAVLPWPGGNEHPAGAILVEHLANTSPAEEIREDASSASHRQRSLEAVWNLLHPDEEAATPSAVRAVVIDALTLLDPTAPSAEGRALRAELIEFIQALEGEGRSVVLVEELGAGTPAWSAFVVDVVFELSMVPHPRTGELQRKLTLSKCRYAISIPGPHDYGLEHGRPTVWPDLLRVVAGRGDSHGLRRATPPHTLLPVAAKGSWCEVEGRVGLFELTDDHVIELLSRAPGTRAIWFDCSAVTRLIFLSSELLLEAAETESVHALAWMLQNEPLASANTCIFDGLDSLVLREGEDSVVHVLEALAQLGYTVIVRGINSRFFAIRANATYHWGQRVRHSRGQQTVRKSFALAHLAARTDFKDGADNYRLLWRQHLHGLEWAAAYNLITPPGRKKNVEALTLLWLAICAETAAHPDAIGALELHLKNSQFEWLALDPLLRLLARHGDFAKAEQLAQEFCAGKQQPAWMLQRMLIEAGLAAPETEGAPTLDRFSTLLLDASLPPAVRGDLFFTLAGADLERFDIEHELLRSREYLTACRAVERFIGKNGSESALMTPVGPPQE